MFIAFVGLEEEFSCVQLHDNAANGSKVAGRSSAAFQNDFRRPVLSRVDYFSVMVSFEGGSSEVD